MFKGNIFEDRPNKKWKESNKQLLKDIKNYLKIVSAENLGTVVINLESLGELLPHPNEGREYTENLESERSISGIVRMGKIPKGIIKYPNNDYYEREIKNNMAHGLGVMKYSGGSNRYEGRFLYDKRSGVGTMYTSSGVYTGSFLNDKFHGKGVFQFNNGAVFNGKGFMKL